MRKAILYVFAGLGLALSLLIGVGAWIDVRSFDRTQGGYEPPYTGYTGEPTDWDATDVTETGMVRHGLVLDTLFDCATGMIEIELYGQRIPFRKVSERGIKVHKPREACAERGFKTGF